MNKIPLSDYVKAHGQAVTATTIGVTQGAISKALAKARNIFVFDDGKGKIRAEEVRPFPSQK